MEDLKLKGLWKAQDEKLDRTMKLTLHLLESLQKQKAESKLNSLARFKLWAVMLGVVWVLFLGLLIYGDQLQNIYFTISVGIILIFNILAVVLYIKHIVLIRQLDYSQSITNTQQKLSALQASTFNTRFLLLQTPFYTTWFWSTKMIESSGIKFWLIAVPVTAIFSILAIWLYRNLIPGKMHKKWVRTLINGTPEHTSVMKAQDFLNEIEEFKKE
ncbi:MAG: hypothetical protein ABI685_13015 [Ferruginibacter sp.]